MADLFIGPDLADDLEIAAVRAAIGEDPAVVHERERLVIGGGARRRARRQLLLPALHALQHAKGWISPGGLNHVCDQLQVPPAEAYGVATFYELFRTEEPTDPGEVTHVCVDAACQIAGAPVLIDQLAAAGSTVHRSPCLGQCEKAPARFVQGVGTRDRVPVDTEPSGRVIPQEGDPSLVLLANVGVVDPTSLESYRSRGGYLASARAIEIGADAVRGAINGAGLTGRGGAAFPTGVKWDAVAAEAGRPKHVVANCDESEPGTFKDRIVMEHDPFAVVEALTLAGVATGAENGWIYIRGEYPLATERLSHAVAEARAAGLLGPDAAGSGHAFDIEIRRGAGAYICGEETALFASIEGYRGEPRSKPPYPTSQGLFGEPTAINNPETLLNTLDIVRRGAEDHCKRGTDHSPGTKLFCVSGRVAEPGLYEVDFGTSLGDLLELAGGLTGSGGLQAVLLGGAAGSFVGPDAVDLPLTLEDTRARGTTLGSGVVMVFTDEIEMAPVLERIAEFFRNESCGQCVPCRIGTVRQHETMVQLSRTGSLTEERRALVDDIAAVMADASICGLGHTAATAIGSALDLGLIGGAGMTTMETAVSLRIDGQDVEVAAGTSIHKACESVGIDTPTLCWAENLTPVSVCRVCVVEVEGSRPLVPACARAVEDGMVVQTDSERVRRSRRMVLEFLGSGVDLGQADDLGRWIEHYGAEPGRYEQADVPVARIDEDVLVQDDLYIRDYDKCVLCYKCVEACGDDAQHTFAIAVSGRGFDARISTEFDVTLPESACVYCGNCIGVCPTGAIQDKTEFDLRNANDWRPETQSVTTTVCSFCGVGCNLELHTQDDRIVKVTSPQDHSVTHGHLCIKGRFGWQYVQPPTREP